MFNLQNKIVTKETGLTILKSLIAATPGGIIINEYMELRGRIKQERLNNFLTQFSEYLIGNTIEAKPDLNEEDFNDLFESVIKRVTQTKSAEKHVRFRDILLNFIEKPNMEIDEAEIFLSLVTDLSEPAILILKRYKGSFKDLMHKNTRLAMLERDLPNLNGQMVTEKSLKDQGFANNFESINKQRLEFDHEIKKLRVEISALNAVNVASTYGLEEDNFLFFKQILLSKGLLRDLFTGSAVGGSRPFANMRITEFGIRFVDFLVR